MPLGTDYPEQDCAIARSLEIVGERWTLLIVRDLFYGVRRYSDLRKHIGLPPATLTDRLAHLLEAGVAQRIRGNGARDEYALTPKGETLWPVIYGLLQWGSENYVETESRMLFTHHQCGNQLDGIGWCRPCGMAPKAADVVLQRRSADNGDPFAIAMKEPHRLLTPLRV